MRSKAGDNQASCTVLETDEGCDVVITFAKGSLAPTERFIDPAAAMRHAYEIAHRLSNQGWTELDSE